ncbi:hypothetical protein E1B28_000982 [Marasmius oreades]|uniref:Uncharacterized protein n=1 Tax=Marasmius oreades TaxID=181124 RepID=A0A9P7V2K1_9AGAR|nr:uncharacterized protein E1B28_000982 [Marasmius oreades]KAG7099109.1 hypothetical protein E1B28_000982 [Marasmius oreades]
MIKLPGDEEQLLEPLGNSVEFSETSAGISALVPEDPPPLFEPYSADYFIDNTGNVVSHDLHLNTDGEALYRFLLSQSTTRPSLLLHCKGSHQETRYRTVTSRRSDGHSHHRTESYTETVTDFDLIIDLSNVLLSLQGAEPAHWSCSDTEPAYRGRMYREIEQHAGKRRSRRAENKAFDKWTRYRENSGLPPWVSDSPQGPHVDPLLPSNALKSSKTVRQWADEYCASPKHLKEFTYRKVIYGWDMNLIHLRVNNIITSAVGPLYRGTIEVDFEHRNNKIYIRPDNQLSRILSNVWFKILLWILLIYPFIWLYKRFHYQGGGRWEVCGGAYPITRYIPLESLQQSSGKQPEQPPPDYNDTATSSSTDDERIKTSSDGRRFVRQGVTEKQWLTKWESSINQAVRTGHQSSIPLAEPISQY